MMKRILLFVMVALVCHGVSAMQASANVLEVRIEQVSLTGQVTVTLHNLGREPLNVWRRGNSWGAARWRILHISNDGVLHTHYQNPDQIFTVNFPGFDAVTAAKPLQLTLDLNDRHWLPRGEQETTFAPGDTVIALYDVPTSDEAQKHGVWYGATAAKAVVK